MQEDLLEQLKKDFRNFTWWLWKQLGLPEPTLVQYDICRYLATGPRRRMIEAFRGVGKSWLTAAYVIWRLLRNANERILVVSASKGRATAFAVFVKRLINEMPLLRHLRPDTSKGHRDSNEAFDVGPSAPHQSPSVRVEGITGQITGSRASIIVGDDIEVPKNSLTHTMREKLSEAVKEFDAVIMTEEDLKAMGMENSEVIYLGTPQTEESLYNKLPSRGYDMRIWPARFCDPAKYSGRMAPMLLKLLAENPQLRNDCNGRGAPTDPKRFTDVDLIERESSYGRSGFALQFLLDTSVSDGNRYPLKLSDLVVMNVAPDVAPVKIAWGSGPDQIVRDNLPVVGLTGDRLHRPMFTAKDFLPYSGVCMAIDPAGRGGDELAYCVIAMLNGFLYLLDCKGLKNGYSDENLKTLALVAKKFGVKHIVIEENFGDGMFTKLLTPFLVREYPCTTEEVKHSIQKEKRIIDTLEPVMNQHRLVVDEALIRADAENYNGYSGDKYRDYQLFHQLTRITKDRGALAKDDRVDVLAIAVAYWVEQMDKDVQSIEKDHKAAALDKELERFMKHVLGHAPVSDNWIQ